MFFVNTTRYGGILIGNGEQLRSVADALEEDNDCPVCDTVHTARKERMYALKSVNGVLSIIGGSTLIKTLVDDLAILQALQRKEVTR